MRYINDILFEIEQLRPASILEHEWAEIRKYIMDIFDTAVTAAKVRADALQTEIDTLKANEVASVKANEVAIATAVTAATAGTISEQAAADAVNTIAVAKPAA